MMKKVYEKPEMAVERFSNEDVITASGGLVLGNFTKDTSYTDNVIDY